LHPGDALLHSLGVQGPDQVFEGHSESRLHVYIVFVHSPVNTTTSSACTRSHVSLGTSPSGDESGLRLTNVVYHSPFLSSFCAVPSGVQNDIHSPWDPSIPFHIAINSVSRSLTIYTLPATSLFIPNVPFTCGYCVTATFRAPSSF
jgi:hypothetical protein